MAEAGEKVKETKKAGNVKGKMKLIGLSTFAVVIIIATVTFWLTLKQEPFLVPVSIKFFNFDTPAVSVLWYVTGAFILGLTIGSFWAMSNGFAKIKSERSLKKEIGTLRAVIDELKGAVVSAAPAPAAPATEESSEGDA